MWDYIIVGAGAAGCVVANRLSAEPRNKVLLLEAGGAASALKFRVPALGALKAVGNPESDWMLLTEPDPSRLGKVDLASRGKVVGGSSSVNGTIYVRGNRGDYDGWAQAGNSGWDYDSLLPFFRRVEDDASGLSADYGKGGPIKLSRARGAHPIAKAFVSGWEEMQVAANPDYNGPTQQGAAITHVNQRRGWRWGSARGYIDPIRSRPNIEVATGCVATRILIEGGQAVGVEYEQDGVSRVARCSGEVIVSSSAYNTPKLLMLSGIGDPETLAGHGIEVVHANEYVGRNLQEHPGATVVSYVTKRTSNMDLNLLGQLKTAARFALFGSGPATLVFPAVAFVKLHPGSEYPDLQFHFGAFAYEPTPDGPTMMDRSAITLLVNVNRSQSRGEVTLRSADPHAPPRIQPNMLSARYDVETLMGGVKLARQLIRTKAFEPYFQGEQRPGDVADSDAGLEDYVRRNASPCYHPCGTAKMGIGSDAVVDPRLRVLGVRGLRVVDSSIIPQIPSGNLNAISMAIGEKGADMILEDRRQA
jgi:choline dehydrogenase